MRLTPRCNPDVIDLQFRGRFIVRSLSGHLPATLQPLIPHNRFLWISHFFLSVIWIMLFIARREKLFVLHRLLAGLSISLFVDCLLQYILLHRLNSTGTDMMSLRSISSCLHLLVLVYAEGIVLLIAFGYVKVELELELELLMMMINDNCC